jgi:hypothetical protein
METKLKTCTKGINKAKGFDGCGNSTMKLTYGLCNSCLWDFYHNDERGKIIYQKSFLPKVSLKLKSFQKQNKADLRQKLKTLSQYEAEAKKSFQKYVRLRDKDLACISCGTTKAKTWHGSHYFSANLYSGLIFNEKNVHKSCDYCNVFLHGNLLEYRKGLLARFGWEYVAKLENIADQNRVYKYTKDELIEIKKKYDGKIKELEGK